MGLMTRHCRECGRDQLFEQPHAGHGSCPDSMDGDCLEWACTGCGAALFAGLIGVAAGGGRLRPGLVA